MCDPITKELKGFNVVVGGGMGRSHRNEATFAMMAEPIGYVPKDDIFHAVKAIVATQRDYGRRDDRKQARLKYLLHEWGMDKFRRVTEQYYGKQFEAFKPLPPWEHVNYLGWGEQGDGKLYCGVYVQNGRVKGVAKKAFREVVEKYGLNAIITAEQDLVLTGIDPADRAAVQATLEAAGLDTEAGAGANPTNRLDASAIACPALPLCGLAMSEAERGLPDINARLVALLDRVGLGDESFVVRMTGCPDGCARPYMPAVVPDLAGGLPRAHAPGGTLHGQDEGGQAGGDVRAAVLLLQSPAAGGRELRGLLRPRGLRRPAGLPPGLRAPQGGGPPPPRGHRARRFRGAQARRGGPEHDSEPVRFAGHRGARRPGARAGAPCACGERQGQQERRQQEGEREEGPRQGQEGHPHQGALTADLQLRDKNLVTRIHQ